MINQLIEPTNQLNQQSTNWDQPTKWSKTTARQGRRLWQKPKLIEKQLIKQLQLPTILQMILEWGLELVKGLDQGLEVWNQPGARSRLRKP